MDNNIIKKTEKELQMLYREIYLAKCQYIILEKLYKDLLNPRTNDKLLITKKTVFDAVEYSVFLKLSKIYDIDKRDASVTLYKMLNKIQCVQELNKNDKKIQDYIKEKLEFLQNNETIKYLKFFRDKNISHLDKGYIQGIKGLHKEYNLTFNDIKTLLDEAYDIIKMLFKLVLLTDYSNDEDFEILNRECEACDNEFYN